MGFALSWVASPSQFSQAEYGQLEAKFSAQRKKMANEWSQMLTRLPTAQRAQIHLPEFAIFDNQKLPSGWWLMLFERCDVIFSADDLLRDISKGHNKEVVACAVEEHVMMSRIACYRAGQRIWHFMHELDKGKYNLQIDGTPPPQFGAIAAKYRNLQNSKDDADYIFDIPVALGKAIVGYRHDMS